MTKFSKKAFRKALKENDQTRVWYLTAIKLGRTPQKKEVYDLIREIALSAKDIGKAYYMAYTSNRKRKFLAIAEIAWYNRGAYAQCTNAYYRSIAIDMLRKLITEENGNYTKVPMLGFTHLYFCSPAYGHSDYNKVRTCLIEGNEDFCSKIIEIAEKFLNKKEAP